MVVNTELEREITTELVRVDNPSRLAARRKAIAWIYQPKDEEGNKINVVNKLFDEIAVQYKERAAVMQESTNLMQGAATVL